MKTSPSRARALAAAVTRGTVALVSHYPIDAAAVSLRLGSSGSGWGRAGARPSILWEYGPNEGRGPNPIDASAFRAECAPMANDSYEPKPGDVVKLKSGGQRMLVAHADPRNPETGWTCTWHEPRSASFQASGLELAEPMPESAKTDASVSEVNSQSRSEQNAELSGMNEDLAAASRWGDMEGPGFG